MISVRSLNFSYGKLAILNNVNLTFESGLCHIILGPSGSGKSTFLKLIAGLLQSNSGSIIRPKTYGYVLQEGGLFNHLNVFENISIQSQQLGWNNSDITKRVNELCELTQFPKERLKLSPLDISGGQRQRIALMRALFLKPEMLMLDESLTGLDPLLKYDLLKDLRKIISQLKITTLHVTHDLVEAAHLGDNIVLLNAGQVEEVASKLEFFSHPKKEFTKKFLQSQKVEI